MKASTSALLAQAVWYVAATVFNGLSLRDLGAGKPGWAGDQALLAQVVATAIGLATLTGVAGWVKAYRFAAPVAATVLVVGGVLRHLVADPAAYASQATWAAAILINLFGAAAYGRGSLLIWRQETSPTTQEKRSP